MLVLLLATQIGLAKPPIDWATPQCTLAYSIQTDASAQILDATGQPVIDTGARRTMQFEMKPDDEHITLAPTAAHRSDLANDRGSNTQMVPAVHLWSATVRPVNGELVSEEITELWVSSRWGLNLMWPALPTGESRVWRVLREHQGHGAGPVNLTITVRPTGPNTYEGVKVYAYSGSWTALRNTNSTSLDARGAPTANQLSLTEKGEGTWWVSKQGTLVAAEVDVQTDLVHSSTSGPRTKQTAQKLRLSQTLRLTKDCKGPVLQAH
jgi:hypothetical protein